MTTAYDPHADWAREDRYIETMVQNYAIAALWSSLNDLFGTSLCDKCSTRVVERTNAYGTEWRDAVNEMDADCSEGGAHEVTDEEDHSESLDGDYDVDDIDDATMDDFRVDCRDFYQANRADLVDMDAEQAGHDFWLTRNGHGAGFWDRGLGERGDRLTAASKPYGEVYLWVDIESGTVRDN